MTTTRLNFVHPLLILCLLVLTASARAELPEWIWRDNNKGEKPTEADVRFFRKSFKVDGKVTKAVLAIAADDTADVFLNGEIIGHAEGWEPGLYLDITKDLKTNVNVLALQVTRSSKSAGVIALLELTYSKSRTEFILTDANWLSAASGPEGWPRLGFDDRGWDRARSLGKAGVEPWGGVLHIPTATPASQLTVLPGFKVELLRSAELGEGSWISMAIDPAGRLIISPQSGTGNLLRFTLARDGQVEKTEKINQPVGSAMGLLCAFDSLYVNGEGPSGLGLYRLHYNFLKDTYDSARLVRRIENAGGEHGSHAVVLGPDQKLYVINGNFTKVPKDISPTSPHRNYAEDQLLPRGPDGSGFGDQLKPPGGFLLRMDPDGRKCELVCAGMRNTYDFAFNAGGEIFGFDSDMEWDWGTPWYRPTRICHLVSGGEYGFREGTGKWPGYYPDSLPSTVDIGIGSPTGMKFGTKSNFPEKYKNALYALDWSYGRIFAVHLTPNGASYNATYEPFLKGKPLNLTDIEFGKDGAMYFITGGRGTESGLYRVSYVGSEPSKKLATSDQRLLNDAAQARELRHKLEQFHGRKSRKAVDFAWQHLDSNDRFIRYAARIAVESQPVNEWRDRALNESRTNAALTALLALARCDGRESQGPLLRALTKFPLDSLSESQKLEKLRVIELSCTRQGRPDAALAKMGVEKLSRQDPAKSEALNRELCELLIYLEAPDVVAKTLTLLDAAPTQEEQLHYMFHLRTLTNGWAMDQREHYFNWFNRKVETEQHPAELLKWFAEAGREYSDGSSFGEFIANSRKDAVASLTDDDRVALAPVILERKSETYNAAARPPFVKEWKMEDLQSALNQVSETRSFAQGRDAFTIAQCIQCHRFGNTGGAIGPDLTAISSRFTRRDILESILEPSKVVSEQFQNTTITKKDGDDVTGRIVEENEQKLVVMTDPLNQTKVEVLKSDVAKRAASKLSPMPEGLVNNLTRAEVLDLIAYLECGGKETAAAFQKQ